MIQEGLVTEYPFVVRNSCSFQITKCVTRIWKAYLESVYILNDILAIWKTLVKVTSSALLNGSVWK